MAWRSGSWGIEATLPAHRIHEEHFRWTIAESAIAIRGWIRTFMRRWQGIPFRIAREAGLA